MSQVYNFSAGPAMIPEEVRQAMQAELLEFSNTKASVMEISHRGRDFMEMANKTEQDLRELMNIPAEYQVLFLQGGASAQFSMVPINLLRGKKTANYACTGHWSKKAITEAQRYCEVNICTDSFAEGCTDIADFSTWKMDPQAAYLHYTPNETIAGLEFDYVPEVDIPLVADMSSSILSRPIDVKKFGVIYAGAQKNIGIAGLTVVIVRKDLIGQALPKQPILFDYSTQASHSSMFNTPPTYAWYVAGKVFEWLKNKGGLEAMAKTNQDKSRKLYNFIDQSNFYRNFVRKKYRSWMNVPFFLANEKLEGLFLDEAFKANLLALKGHRLMGGLRASIYNAIPERGVNALIGFMQDFEKKHG